MLGKLFIGAMVILVFLAACVLHLNRQLEKQELVTSAQKEVINALYENTKIVDQIEKDRKIFEQHLDEYRQTLYTEMRRVLRNDKKAASWAATPIPDSVLQLQQTGDASTGKPNPSRK